MTNRQRLRGVLLAWLVLSVGLLASHADDGFAPIQGTPVPPDAYTDADAQAASGWTDVGSSVNLNTAADNVLLGTGLLQFGGATSSFPALKRSGAIVQVRLADDSAFAALMVKSDPNNAGIFFGSQTSADVSLRGNGSVLDVRRADGAAWGSVNAGMYTNDTGTLYVTNAEIRQGHLSKIGWSSATPSTGGNPDCGFKRSALGVVAVTDGMTGDGSLIAQAYQSRIFKLKTADESVTSSTTPQDDDHLTVTLAASARYSFEFVLFTTNVGALEGAKYELSGTVGVTSMKAQVFIYDDTTDALASFSRVTALDSAVGAGLGSGVNYTTIKGTIETSTAGTLLLQFAQNTSGADAVTLERGSTLTVLKLDQ